MRLTSKSQMTVPKEVREAMGLKPGSKVAFERNADGEFVLINLDARRKVSPGEELVRHIAETAAKLRAEGKLSSEFTTDELMEMTRGPYNDLDNR
jgi:AbrB family looped-hinge helix DNA binding protein